MDKNKEIDITKEIYDVLGVVPVFISTYNSRKFAYPELVKEPWLINPNDLYKLLVSDNKFQLIEVIKVPITK